MKIMVCCMQLWHFNSRFRRLHFSENKSTLDRTFRIFELNTNTCFCQHGYFDVKCSVILFPKSRLRCAVTKLHSDDLCALVILLLVNKRNVQQEEEKKKKKKWKCAI